jgi:DNA polymerase delta subunit 2
VISADFPAAESSRRASAEYKPLPKLTKPFLLDDVKARSYKAQFANIYFLRLLQLRPVVAKVANERWKNVKGMPNARLDMDDHPLT